MAVNRKSSELLGVTIFNFELNKNMVVREILDIDDDTGEMVVSACPIMPSGAVRWRNPKMVSNYMIVSTESRYSVPDIHGKGNQQIRFSCPEVDSD